MKNIQNNMDSIVSKVLNEELNKKIKNVNVRLTTNKKLNESAQEIDETEEFYEIAKKRKMERMEKRNKFDGRDSKVVGVDSDIKKQRMEEKEMTEGNAFSEARCKAICSGQKSFKVDGKSYPVKDADDKDKKDCGCESMKESKKKSLKLTEDEMIELIERIVIQEKSAVDSLDKKRANETKKTNDESVKNVTKKMKEYMKNMGIQYDSENEDFPRGNTKMDIEDFGKSKNTDDKKMYQASDAVDEYIDQIARSGGMENLDYDQIQPDNEWLEMNIKGSDLTGNSAEYANAVKTDVNDKVNQRREKNILAKLKKQSYQKSDQPVYDIAGSKKHNDEMKQLGLESIDEKKKTKINEEMEKMKNLISYKQKTQ